MRRRSASDSRRRGTSGTTHGSEEVSLGRGDARRRSATAAGSGEPAPGGGADGPDPASQPLLLRARGAQVPLRRGGRLAPPRLGGGGDAEAARRGEREKLTREAGGPL